MTDILNRDLSYFRTLRNNKRLIESSDIDSEFTSVADYLNNKIIPDINALVAEALPGINGSPDYFLTNIGDGSVVFDTLNNVIVDSTIASNKLIKSVFAGAVLISDNLGQLAITVPTNLNMVLTYRNNDYPIYKFITTNNIEDRAITAADIADGVINKEHLHQEILNIIDAAVPNEITAEILNITGNNFIDFSITTNRFAPNTISTNQKLGIISNSLPSTPLNNSKIVLRRHIKNGTITPNKIKPGTIGALHFNKVKCITKNKLAPQIIDDIFFRLKIGEGYAYLHRDPLHKTLPFSNRMLSPDFRLKRRHLYTTGVNGYFCVRATDFEPAVQRAFNRFRCY